MPMTARNVMQAVQTARLTSPVPVSYFSSVPFVLQRLAEDDGGVDMLRSMTIVSFGGAALPVSVGDALVEAGVHLSSRFGSAESGFLMSSHRDYAVDDEWQYLRPVQDEKLLSFEPRGRGLWELVVKPAWPVRAKTNRPDGSYATSDLFEPHPHRSGLWRHHSRADGQMTLLNGKKFDPAPMEADILASTHNLLRDVLIFGEGRDYPGLLLFPLSNQDDDVSEKLWPEIERVNATTASHARITKPMLIVIPDEEIPLPKSSKGSILRHQAQEKYASVIDSAYRVVVASPAVLVPDGEVLPIVLDCFRRVLARTIHQDDDLFRQGVDSIACIQVRNLLQAASLTRRELPPNVIYDTGTVTRLVSYILRLRNGQDGSGEEDEEACIMNRLVNRYTMFPHLDFVPRNQRPTSIVLTGATGFMGARVLRQLLQNTSVNKVYCLVRATTRHEALERVKRSLRVLGPDCESPKLACLPYNLSITELGLSGTDELLLTREATVYIHLAWAVNFGLNLSSFEHHISGTHHLLTLSAKSRASFFFISSTAAVLRSSNVPIPETPSEDATEASPLGYGRSKWVAERVCAVANRLYASSAPVSVIRVGQLCGDEDGVWNASEAFPLMLSTASVAGCLPDLPGEVLNWLPVEQAARAVTEIALSSHPVDKMEYGSQTGTLVYHVLNPSPWPTWKQLLQWVSEEEGGPCFQIVSPKTWLSRLEEALKCKRPSGHPAEPLLEVWKNSYSEVDRDPRPTFPEFDIERSQRMSATLRLVGPLSRERVIKLWRWIQCVDLGRVQATDNNHEHTYLCINQR
ncbi:linear gramicidin synthase subunit d [Ophiocordyceps camponoti-floridani]|uniref:Linear gramicidin synthase subunit d n=1 Tax=Ophiocordyceps camponoti-floridani TaxID=2030778 RepID=A0A8H4Q8W2_9HYPO|nr:linear gramicidin synthase subunit d [Ophiocordyceps camponoti-floridani]